MSCVYFNTPDGWARLAGAERYHAAHVAEAVGLTMLLDAEWDALVPQPNVAVGHRTREMLRVLLSVSAEDYAYQLPDGSRHGVWQTLLNTAIATGADPVCLLAHIHGQCEIHCYTDGEHREWLASIIESGRRVNVMRPNMGWEGVVSLLRSSSVHPVVMSYSVTEGFPNSAVAQWDGTGEAWAALPKAEQWRLATGGLRATRKGCRLAPETLRRGFGTGLSAFDVVHALKPVRGQ